ncbi:hypothetical protein MJM59_31755, partial [Salmonella enterica subsp. enterica serovar Montevideo]|nr:hypothetical protein [Salmonella enterica subsp. enterica serovar Montevideo]
IVVRASRTGNGVVPLDKGQPGLVSDSLNPAKARVLLMTALTQIPVHVPGPGPAQIQADAFYLCAQGTGNSCLLTVVISVPVTAGR